MADKTQAAGLTSRQKATAGVFVVIVLFLIWQLSGLFGGGNKTTAIQPVATRSGAMSPNGSGMNAQPMAPQPPQQADVPKQPVMTEREAELVKLQQDTEAKYIAALNELQMLKVSRDIAETNQAIIKAKLETVTAEKNIVDLLTKPAPQATPATYAQGLMNPAAGGMHPPTQQVMQQQQQEEISYTVVSVSQLKYKWNAVLGSGGNLYNVTIGDVLPADGSIVMSIDKSGVLLEKNGVKKKVSLVPII